MAYNGQFRTATGRRAVTTAQAPSASRLLFRHYMSLDSREGRSADTGWVLCQSPSSVGVAVRDCLGVLVLHFHLLSVLCFSHRIREKTTARRHPIPHPFLFLSDFLQPCFITISPGRRVRTGGTRRFEWCFFHNQRTGQLEARGRPRGEAETRSVWTRCIYQGLINRFPPQTVGSRSAVAVVPVRSFPRGQGRPSPRAKAGTWS